MRLSFAVAFLLGSAGRWAFPADCEIKINSVTTCDEQGKPYQPRLGDAAYFIRVDWTVTGTPSGRYDVRFRMANREWTWTGLRASSGKFSGHYGTELALDGEIPYSVTVDPGDAAGDRDRADNTLGGSFTPIPPAVGVEHYAAAKLRGVQSSTASLVPGSGHVGAMYLWLGVPTTDSFQVAEAPAPPPGSDLIRVGPNDRPVYKIQRTDFDVDASNRELSIRKEFTVSNSATRVNREILRSVTWQDLARPLPAEVRPWSRPGPRIQSNDPKIAAFVGKSLPADYRSTMTPYDAARALFLAVARTLTYELPPTSDGTAAGTLASRRGDCGGFSFLYAACLRRVGIPARPLCGWWVGKDQTHCLVDFYLPGQGWIPADPTTSHQADPTGTYAFGFGYAPFTNRFCFVSVGDEYRTPYLNTSMVQIGSWAYYGSAKAAGFAWSISLGP